MGQTRTGKKKGNADEKGTARQLQHIIKVICSAPMHLLPRISISIKYKRVFHTHTHTPAELPVFPAISKVPLISFSSSFASHSRHPPLSLLSSSRHSFLSKLSVLARDLKKERESCIPLRFWDPSSYAIFALYF